MSPVARGEEGREVADRCERDCGDAAEQARLTRLLARRPGQQASGRDLIEVGIDDAVEHPQRLRLPARRCTDDEAPQRLAVLLACRDGNRQREQDVVR
jgi:hypothetical protein